MNLTPTPKQEEFITSCLEFKKVESETETKWTNKHSVIYYGGAIRGGKTVGGLLTLRLFCQLFPGSRWAVVRASIEDIKRTTLPSFYNLFPAEYLVKAPNSSNNWVAEFKNGSKIIFFSENYSQDKELNRWRGLEVNGFMLEECNELQFESFNKALERKGTWRMNHRWSLGESMPAVYPSIILMTSNPSPNWVKEYFHDPYMTGKLNPAFKYIPATVYDNPHAPEDWIEEKRMVLTQFNFQRFVEGDWEITENDRPFITEFRRDLHLYDEGTVPIYDTDSIIISLDFNVEPPTAILAQNGLGFCNIFDECTLEKGSIYDVAKWIKSMYPGFNFKVTGDATGGRHIADKDMRNNFEILCKELGIDYTYDKLTPAANPRINGPTGNRAVCNAVFRLITQGLQIRIDKRCKKLIQDIQNARVDKMGELVKNRDNSVYFMDSLDAFRYLMNTIYGNIVDRPDLYLPKK